LKKLPIWLEGLQCTSSFRKTASIGGTTASITETARENMNGEAVIRIACATPTKVYKMCLSKASRPQELTNAPRCRPSEPSVSTSASSSSPEQLPYQRKHSSAWPLTMVRKPFLCFDFFVLAGTLPVSASASTRYHLTIHHIPDKQNLRMSASPHPQVYGMSECCGATTISTDQQHSWGSIGFSMAGPVPSLTF
jgi:hypothetical protein